MSGDQLDLDAIEARAARAGQSWVHDPYGHLTTLVGYDVPALIAEVRRLRAVVERVEDACHEWIDGADSDRFQRHVASKILGTLDDAP